MRIPILLVIVVAVIGATVAGTLLWSRRHSDSIELASAEVRQYEGEDLSSINDFRENSIKGVQYVDTDTYRLQITGLVESPTDYTYDQVVDSHDHYQKVVTLDCVEGWSVNILWRGVLLTDLLAEAHPSPDANTVIFHAYDGYTTSLPIAYLRDKDIIMAYEMNGLTIPPERGFPFVLVAESKWGYKWAKWITGIELSNDPSYKGYWESRGYSNDGDIDSDFLE